MPLEGTGKGKAPVRDAGKAPVKLDRQDRKRKALEEDKLEGQDPSKRTKPASSGLARLVDMMEYSAHINAEQLNQQAGHRQPPDSPAGSGDRTPRPGDDYIVVNTPSAGSGDRTPRPGDQQGEPPSTGGDTDARKRHISMMDQVVGPNAHLRIDAILLKADRKNPRSRDVVNRQIASTMQEFREQELAMYKLNNIEPSLTAVWRQYMTKAGSTFSQKTSNFIENTRDSILILDDYIGRRVSGQDQTHTDEEALDALEHFESSLRDFHKQYSQTNVKKSFYEKMSKDIEKLDNIIKAYDDELKAKATNLRGIQ